MQLTTTRVKETKEHKVLTLTRGPASSFLHPQCDSRPHYADFSTANNRQSRPRSQDRCRHRRSIAHGRCCCQTAGPPGLQSTSAQELCWWAGHPQRPWWKTHWLLAASQRQSVWSCWRGWTGRESGRSSRHRQQTSCTPAAGKKTANILHRSVNKHGWRL